MHRLGEYFEFVTLRQSILKKAFESLSPETRRTLHLGRSLRISIAASMPFIRGITTPVTRKSNSRLRASSTPVSPLYATVASKPPIFQDHGNGVSHRYIVINYKNMRCHGCTLRL